MTKKCALCGKITNNSITRPNHNVCFFCIGKLIDFAITAGMRFEEGGE